MKVLNVVAFLDPVTGGGAAERTIQMSLAMVKNGVECGVLTTDFGLTPERLKSLSGIDVVALPCFSVRYYLPRFSYFRLKELIGHADIVHLIGHWSFLNALVYVIVRSLGKPYVVCPAGSLPLFGRSWFKKRVYNLFIGNRLIRDANGFVAVTKGELPHFNAYGVDSAKVEIIPNGINPDEFAKNDSDGFRKKYALEDKPFILFMGRLNYIKGPDLLLKAFCKIKDDLKEYHLVYVGPDNGMMGQLKDIVAKCGLAERVHFSGYIDTSDKSSAYNAADLLVIPSRQEAMSIVVLEAGITGTPVLITDQCGFNEIAAVNGGLVVDASVEGISKGLLVLLRNKSNLKTMGKALNKFVLDGFLWEAVVTKYLELYEHILDN